MAGKAEDGEAIEVPKPLGRKVESLGWLTESTLQPKKQRLIEGKKLCSYLLLAEKVDQAAFAAPLASRFKGYEWLSRIEHAFQV
jgi:hypothetical protein